MTPIDDEIGLARACVIDGDAVSRAALVEELQSCGIGVVDSFAGPSAAREALPGGRYDIVVCESVFADEFTTGQDLVDDLRQAGQLPLSTIVVLISSQATYAKVAEAAEAALDAYLIKPYRAEALRLKLAEARQRKRQLQPILDKIEQQAFAEAAALCREVYEGKTAGWIQAARIGAELLLKLGDAQGAMKLQETVMATKALPWSRTGLTQAPAQPGAAALPTGRRTLESLLAEQPGHTDAYDVMCRTLLEQGDREGALAAARRAVRLTPENVPRLQKLGVLAFYYGEPDEAQDALHRATEIGLDSRGYDLQGLVLLGALQLDLGQTRALVQTHGSFGRLLGRMPHSVRLDAFNDVFETLRLLAAGRSGDAGTRVQAMLGAAREPLFDFEAACNTLMLSARLPQKPDAARDAALEQLGKRFAVSRASCDLMTRAVRQDAAAVARIRRSYARVGELAQDAVTLSVQGEPQAAAKALLSAAEQTLNGRLLDLAEHTLLRHHDTIGEIDALQRRVRALRELYHAYGAQLRLPPGAGADGT